MNFAQAPLERGTTRSLWMFVVTDVVAIAAGVLSAALAVRAAIAGMPWLDVALYMLIMVVAVLNVMVARPTLPQVLAELRKRR